MPTDCQRTQRPGRRPSCGRSGTGEAAATPAVSEDLLAELREVVVAADPVPGPVTTAAHAAFSRRRPGPGGVRHVSFLGAG